MSAPSKDNQIEVFLSRNVNNGTGRLTSPYHTFEFYPGLKGLQICSGEAFLIVVVRKLLLFHRLINGSSKAW
jgi:hypothetical protein